MDRSVEGLCIYSLDQNLYVRCYNKDIEPEFDSIVKEIKRKLEDSINSTLQIYYYTRKISDNEKSIETINYPIIYRSIESVQMFIIGCPEENEMFLADTATTVSLAINSIVGVSPTPDSFLALYSKVAIVLSEIIDGGYVISSEVPDVMKYEQTSQSTLKTFLTGAKFIAKTFIN